MKVLITGADGQLGVEIVTRGLTGATIIAVNRGRLDITNAQEVNRILRQIRPDVVINTAAFTDVAAAQTSGDGRAQAHMINDEAVGNLAASCAALGIGLIHISTDFVFAGDQEKPYTETDQTVPQTVYGQSKLAGETRMRDTDGLRWCIIRTSWLYSAHGQSFVSSVLAKMQQGKNVSIVTDEIGGPTSTGSLHRIINACLEYVLDTDLNTSRIFHWQDQGAISRYEFGCEIQRAALALNLLSEPVTIKAVSADQMSTIPRPAYSVLNTRRASKAFGLEPADYREALAQTLRDWQRG